MHSVKEYDGDDDDENYIEYLLGLFHYCLTVFCHFSFLQRVSIACYAERCISHSKSVVRPSVCPSHAGTESN